MGPVIDVDVNAVIDMLGEQIKQMSLAIALKDTRIEIMQKELKSLQPGTDQTKE